mgnify:FL=1
MLHNPDKQEDVVAEESKQIKEPGTQVSSQPKIEEEKQAPGEREQATSPQRNIITTGNSFSRLSKLIYQNYLTCGRRDSHGLSNFTCLVFEKN